MSVNAENEMGTKVLFAAILFFVGYVKYLFLTVTVIFSSFVMLFIILGINPKVSFNFLQYFSFINPVYKTGSFRMGINEIMQIFSVLAFILFIIITPIKFALKKAFGLNVALSLKLKIALFSAAITLAYILASAILTFSDNPDKSLFVFIIFYFINIASAAGYFILDALLNRIVKRK